MSCVHWINYMYMYVKINLYVNEAYDKCYSSLWTSAVLHILVHANSTYMLTYEYYCLTFLEITEREWKS